MKGDKMGKGKVTIGMTQFHCVPNREENMRKGEAQIRALAAKGAKIICTQELFNGLYFPQIIDYTKYDWAEPVDGPTNQRLIELSKELDVVIVRFFNN
jgi:N-carbamoylputrescine amidase